MKQTLPPSITERNLSAETPTKGCYEGILKSVMESEPGKTGIALQVCSPRSMKFVITTPNESRSLGI